jgi:RNA polymerase sigma-70 factor (ECF subfamily)
MAQRNALRRFLSARLRDEALAEDMVQDVWVKISKMELATTIENPVGFLFTMAGRLALDHIRQRKRREVRDENWTRQSTHKIGEFAVSQDDNGETRLLRAEQIMRVRNAIAALPPKAGQAFELHRMQGKSHKQVAAQLGISVSTVEKHIIRAMRQLTEILRKPEP